MIETPWVDTFTRHVPVAYWYFYDNFIVSTSVVPTCSICFFETSVSVTRESGGFGESWFWSVHRALLYTTQCKHVYFLPISCLTILIVFCHRTHNVMQTIKPYKKIGEKMKLHQTTPNTNKTWKNKIKCEVKTWSVWPGIGFYKPSSMFPRVDFRSNLTRATLYRVWP